MIGVGDRGNDWRKIEIKRKIMMGDRGNQWILE